MWLRGWPTCTGRVHRIVFERKMIKIPNYHEAKCLFK